MSARRLSWALTSAVLAVLFGGFAVAHVSFWLRTGHLPGVVLAVQETVLVALFVVRRRPLETSRNPLHWIAALAGTFGTLMLRPAGGPLVAGVESLGTALQVVGASLSVYGAVHLGRSFGIVAANRGVKSAGPYRFVRHPLYASYAVSFAGYLLGAFTVYNLVIIGAALSCQVLRIFAEEGVLRRDPSYRTYASAVRWRLVPGVF